MRIILAGLLAVGGLSGCIIRTHGHARAGNGCGPGYHYDGNGCERDHAQRRGPPPPEVRDHRR